MLEGQSNKWPVLITRSAEPEMQYKMKAINQTAKQIKWGINKGDEITDRDERL